jgi:transposase-like protein
MAHGKPRDPRKEQHWRHLIQLWKNSGLTVRAFCDRHQLSQPSFYAWRRELQQRDAATAFVPVRVETDDQLARVTSIPTIEVDLSKANVSESLPASIRRRCDNCWRCFRRAGHAELSPGSAHLAGNGTGRFTPQLRRTGRAGEAALPAKPKCRSSLLRGVR